jgi:phospholipid/cholesterol/gamma-HCH transport system substrate-binding protein
MRSRIVRITLAALLAVVLVAGVAVAAGMASRIDRVHHVAYFDNTAGLYAGDEIRILGVPVGAIDSIEPQPSQVKVSFWVRKKYRIPADVKAVIISPTLITSRAIQLLPAYRGGPQLEADATIPRERTAVPMEWDDLRKQLEKLTESLQPTEPGGTSTLGGFVNTAAENLRGNGATIHDTIIKMSQAFSVLGDHSDDVFGTIKNLSILVSALKDSKDVLMQLNRNLDTVTGMLANDPGEVADAARNVNVAIGDVRSFLSENREALGTTFDKLSSISNAVNESLGDLKQTLHVAPNGFQNFVNIYQPAQAAATGQLALSNFSNPIQVICGAIEAAGKLGAEQSSKLCAQYLAPILKNRQYNTLPLGFNLLSGAAARPNEITYSEDWMRPDFVPPAAAAPPAADASPVAADPSSATSTDPATGLPGLMVPEGGR